MSDFIDKSVDRVKEPTEASRSRQRLAKQQIIATTRRPAISQARIPFEAFRSLFGEKAPDQDASDLQHVER